MIAIIAAIAASVAGGLAVERRFGEERARRLASGVLTAIFWVLMPFVTFFSLARLHVTAGVGAGIALGYVTLAIVGVAAWAIGTRVMRLPRLTAPAGATGTPGRQPHAPRSCGIGPAT